MKKILMMVALTAFAVVGVAQTIPTKFHVTLKDKTVVTYEIADIDSLWFEGEEEKPVVSSDAYRVVIPTDFSTSSVQKVMADGVQVAEICREYVRSFGVIDKQMVVVYPIGSDGKADLTKGLSAYDGGKLAWDLENDSVASYVVGDGALNEVYVVNGEVVATTTASNVIETTTEADLLVDKRGLFERNTYPIVKVGVQYWMGENLKAKSLTDGTSIPVYKSTQADAWDVLTTPAYHVYADDVNDENEILSHFGLMYNGYAVKSEKIAPEGWAVTSLEDWTKMKTYLRSGQGPKVRSTSLAVWDDAIASDLTGLSIPGGGYFSKATGDDKNGTQVYFWTTDLGTDFLGRTTENNLKCAWLSNKSSINLNGDHNLSFGHYIRCIRK